MSTFLVFIQLKEMFCLKNKILITRLENLLLNLNIFYLIFQLTLIDFSTKLFI
jgi:hypothetical protein